MGNSRYSDAAWQSYSKSTVTRSRDEIFTSSKLNQGLDPSKFDFRESRDSDANPNSTPVIVGLDVTGSMGFVAEVIAKKELGPLFQRLYTEKPISDPHICLIGIGDLAAHDKAPLQMSQFEADTEHLTPQLEALFLEGGGGGNNSESYSAAWMLAYHKTRADNWEKRHKKGYIFTIGDEMPDPLIPVDKYNLFARGSLQKNTTLAEILTLVRERWNIYHIVALEGSYARSNNNVVSTWKALLGANVLEMPNHKQLSNLIVSAICENEGNPATGPEINWAAARLQ